MANEIIKKYLRGMFTLKETYVKLKETALSLCDKGYLSVAETDACTKQIDRFYKGNISAYDLQAYIGMVM